MLIFPLQALAQPEGISTLKIVSEEVTNNEILSSTTSTLAGGIGAIFLLFVIFYYVTSILDGGKFQVKMLMPVLIYILACNFNWIVRPVTDFAATINGSLSGAAQNSSLKIIQAKGGQPGDGIMDLYRLRMKEDMTATKNKADQDFAKHHNDETPKVSEDSQSDADDAAKTMKERTNFIERISDAISNSIDKKVGQWSDQLSFRTHQIGTVVKYSITGFLCSILCWVNNLMVQVLKIFGSVMAGIIMAFGPIVWAFAVFPGRGRTIQTWFIRVCQFSLWSPIAAFISYLNTAASLELLDSLSSGADGMFGLCVTFLANIIALTAVPSIAQMILEGASGNVALSGGLQQAAHAVTTASSIATLPIAKGASAVSFASNLSSLSNTKANQNQGETLSGISQKLDQVIQGQNTHK